MAITILPREYGSQSLSGALGEGLGQGLSEGLKLLSQQMIENKTRQNAANFWVRMGLSPQEAYSMTYQPSQVQTEFLNRLELPDQNGQQFGQAPQSGLGALSYLGSQKQNQFQQNQPTQFAQQQPQQPQGIRFRPSKEQQVRVDDFQNQYNALNNQLDLFQQLNDLNKGELKSGLLGLGKSNESQLYESLLESMVPASGTEAQIESARRKLPSLKYSQRNRQQLIDYNINKIRGELGQLEQRAGSSRLLSPTQVQPDSQNVFDYLTQNAQGSPLQKLQTAQSPVNKINASKQMNQQQEPQQPKLAGQEELENLAGAAGYLGKKALKGAGEGITGLATLPFNLANFLSLGNIPVPEVVKQIQDLPEQTVESLFGKIHTDNEGVKFLGNFVEDLSSLLIPGGAISKVGKLSKLAKLEKVGKILNIAPKSAATIAGVGNLAKLAIEKVGGTETEGNIVKAGAMLAVPLLGGRLINSKISALTNEAKNAIKDTDVVRSPSLIKANIDFYNELTRGVQTPLKKQVIDVTDKLFHQRAPAEVKLKDVLEAKDTLTKAMQNSEFNRSLKNAPTYMSELNKALELGVKDNPKYVSLINDINDLTNASQATNTAVDFAKKHLGASRYRSPLTYAILGLAAREATGLPYYKALGVVGLPALTIGEGHRLLQITAKSPAFRKYYGDYIKAATGGSVKAAQQAAKNLDIIIDHEGNKLEKE